MLTTLITIATLFSIILVTHNYVLEAMHKDALSQPQSHTDRTN